MLNLQETGSWGPSPATWLLSLLETGSWGPSPATRLLSLLETGSWGPSPATWLLSLLETWSSESSSLGSGLLSFTDFFFISSSLETWSSESPSSPCLPTSSLEIWLSSSSCLLPYILVCDLSGYQDLLARFLSILVLDSSARPQLSRVVAKLVLGLTSTLMLASM